MHYLILNIISCLFIIAVCIYSLISEYKRNKQMDEIYGDMQERFKKEYL